jgi:hypothetical protein
MELTSIVKDVLPKRHWSDLSAALSRVSVRDALDAYIGAYQRKELAVKVLCDYKVSVDETQSVLSAAFTQSHHEHLCDEAVLAQSNEFNAYRALLVEIHGEKAVEFAEYLDRRRDRYGWDDYGAPLTLRDWDEDQED